MKHLTLPLTLPLAALLMTAGCTPGDSGGSNPETGAKMTLEGRVADGYLVGALVCLDLNNNANCDDNEPDTITLAGGHYRLEDITRQQYEQGQLLVEVSVNAQDEDDNSFVTRPYKLTTPKGHEAFVSPITTLIARTLQLDPNLSEAAALERYALAFGQENPENLLEDFVSNSEQGDPSAEKLHRIAQLVADVMGETKFNLEGNLQAAGGDAVQQANAVELTLTRAITRNTEESNNLRKLVLAALENDATQQQLLINDLRSTLEADASVEQTQIQLNQLASDNLTPAEITTLFRQGFGELTIFPASWCEANSSVVCFETWEVSTPDNSNALSVLETFYEFDQNGNLTTTEDDDDYVDDYEDVIWLLDNNDQFERVEYSGIWRKSTINEDGSYSSHTVYLKEIPSTDPASWTLANIQPFAEKIDTLTIPVSIREKSVAGETLVDILDRMSADESGILESAATPFNANLTFPDDSVGYWVQFTQTDSQTLISPYDDVMVLPDNNECDDVTCDVTFSALDDLFTLNNTNLGIEGWGYLNNADDLYIYQIKFNPSEAGQSSGTAALIRWYYEDYEPVKDVNFAGQLKWQRHADWHGKEAIVIDRLQAYEYGMDAIALVDVGDAVDEPVLWAVIDEATDYDNDYLLNGVALKTLTEQLTSYFSTEPAN
ncbi:hypothetical protein [Saccharospirillum mangrovi]|uniref:hypothetical protein n=1 Tax=Saccharospirillum mangrovi TaxID=2161747 RepID=UPI0013002828|nr:hypothetical protein [Saccharospirillum mangrovi]